jgi:hypothetical protein
LTELQAPLAALFFTRVVWTVFVDDDVDSSLLILNKQVRVVQKFVQAIALMTFEGQKVPSKSKYFFRSAAQSEHTKHRGKEVER